MSEIQMLNRTMRATHTWLKEIGEELDTNEQNSYEVLKAVLHALRDNLLWDESAKVSTQLPTLIRGIYFADWDPSSDKKDRSKKKFVERIEENLKDIESVDPEDACRTVFRTLNYHLSSGELKKSRQSLANPIRSLWPDPEDEDQADSKEPEEEGQDSGADENKENDDKEEIEEGEQDKKAAAENKDDSSEGSSAEPENSASEGILTENATPNPPAERDHTPQRKEHNMQNYENNYYEGPSRNDSRRRYRDDDRSYDEGRFSQRRNYNQNYENRDDERYGGRANANRGRYNNQYETSYARDDDMDYERGHYSGRQYSGNIPYERGFERHDYEGRGYGRSGRDSQYSERENYTAYPRDNNYEVRDYPSRNRYGERENEGRYAANDSYSESSRRNWNEGRRMSGNRQSYGSENKGRWRDDRGSE